MDLTNFIFNSLHLTNKILFINSKDSIIESYLKKYKIGNILIIGETNYKSTPTNYNYSITHLEEYLSSAYEDYSLNSPVDFIYIDHSNTEDFNFSFLSDVFDPTITTLLMKVHSSFGADNVVIHGIKFSYIEIDASSGYLSYVPRFI